MKMRDRSDAESNPFLQNKRLVIEMQSKQNNKKPSGCLFLRMTWLLAFLFRK